MPDYLLEEGVWVEMKRRVQKRESNHPRRLCRSRTEVATGSAVVGDVATALAGTGSFEGVDSVAVSLVAVGIHLASDIQLGPPAPAPIPGEAHPATECADDADPPSRSPGCLPYFPCARTGIQ